MGVARTSITYVLNAASGFSNANRIYFSERGLKPDLPCGKIGKYLYFVDTMCWSIVVLFVPPLVVDLPLMVGPKRASCARR